MFTLPIYAMTRNPAFAYNIAWLCSFPASALAMHWLAWRYTRNHLSALLAGAIYAFSFFKILHGGGHLHLVWTFWIPLALLRSSPDDEWRRVTRHTRLHLTSEWNAG